MTRVSQNAMSITRRVSLVSFFVNEIPRIMLDDMGVAMLHISP